MILNNRDEDLNIVFKVKENGGIFVIFATSGVLKCCGCGQEGHVIRNCPGKEVVGGQETEKQKEKDKHDSEENSVQSKRQEEIKQQKSNTGQEGEEKTIGPEAEEMEKGKENPAVNDNPEQNTEAVVNQSSEESVAIDNMDLIAAVVRSKRKSKLGSSGPQTRKKGLVETEQEKQIVNSQEAVMESGSEQDTNTDTDSDEAKHNKEQAGTYTAKEIKRFLQKTKNMKGVKVDQHFPDRQSFVDSATTVIRDKNKSFTHQEVYRLKKLVTRTRKDLLCDEDFSET
ncbi:uncharacterized protein LOC125139265 [Tachysurus ichikawai]